MLFSSVIEALSKRYTVSDCVYLTTETKDPVSKMFEKTQNGEVSKIILQLIKNTNLDTRTQNNTVREAPSLLTAAYVCWDHELIKTY
jgi:enoyl reductase-like protein